MIGIVVDASTTGGNPGYTECRGLDLETGEIVFSEKIGIATNNIGEWLAIAYGANYIIEKNLGIPLYSDSKIAINWYHQKTIKTNVFRDYPHVAKENLLLAGMIEEGLDIIEKCRVEIHFWNKYKFGENPADYGNKTPYNNNRPKIKRCDLGMGITVKDLEKIGFTYCGGKNNVLKIDTHPNHRLFLYGRVNYQGFENMKEGKWTSFKGAKGNDKSSFSISELMQYDSIDDIKKNFGITTTSPPAPIG